MPMIMDDPNSNRLQQTQAMNEDLDEYVDLFQEAPQATSISQDIANAEVLQRLNELSSNGCCKKLAWSKNNSIVFATDDLVEVYFFTREKDGSGFHLDGPQVLMERQFQTIHFPIADLTWSDNGNDLAVVDARGMVLIFSVYMAINRLQQREVSQEKDANMLGVVVGLYWIPFIRPANWCQSMEKKDSKWSYNQATTTCSGIHHPFSKPTVAIFTSGGTFRLLRQNLMGGWSESSINVNEGQAAEHLFTHASFTAGGDQMLLVATVDTSDNLRVFRMTVDWQCPYKSPPPGFEIQPRIMISQVAVLPDLSTHLSNEVVNYHPKLTHLLLLPERFEPTTKTDIPPTVTAVFTLTDSSPSQFSSSLQSRLTRVVNFAITEAPEVLISKFTELAKKKKRTPSLVSQQLTSISRLSDAEVFGIVVDIWPHRMDTMIYLAKADGSTTCLDRSTLATIEFDPKSQKLTDMAQAGLQFVAGEEPLAHWDLSPNHCVAVVKGQRKDLHLKYLQHSEEAAQYAEGELSLAFAGQNLLYASATLQPQTNDDTMAVMQRNLKTFDLKATLKEIFSVPNLTVESFYDDDRNTKTQKILFSTGLGRALSAQQLLAQRFPKPSIPLKVAGITMELKNVLTGLSASLREESCLQSQQVDLPGSLLPVLGWLFDLVSFLLDDLFNIRRTLRGKDITLDLVQQEVQSRNTPTLSILLSCVPRILLRVAAHYARSIFITPHIYDSHAPHVRRIQALQQRAPVEISRFERFLYEVSHHAQECYGPNPQISADLGKNPQACTDEERIDTEREFLITGLIPERLMPVVQRIFNISLDRMQEGEGGVNPLDFMHMDFRHLGLEDDVETWWHGNGPKVDVIRKIRLGPGVQKWRECARCGRKMEDLLDVNRMPLWLRNCGKSCVCSGLWFLKEPERPL